MFSTIFSCLSSGFLQIPADWIAPLLIRWKRDILQGYAVRRYSDFQLHTHTHSHTMHTAALTHTYTMHTAHTHTTQCTHLLKYSLTQHISHNLLHTHNPHNIQSLSKKNSPNAHIRIITHKMHLFNSTPFTWNSLNAHITLLKHTNVLYNEHTHWIKILTHTRTMT